MQMLSRRPSRLLPLSFLVLLLLFLHHTSARLRGTKGPTQKELEIARRETEEARQAIVEGVMDDDEPDSMEQSPLVPRVLVFGGNGFIGSVVVEHLMGAGFQVTTVNRNSSYFSEGGRKRGVLSRVEHIVWDRTKPLSQCDQLETYFHHHPAIHAVVDLSCYDGKTAEDTAKYLARYRVPWYIYISTDSVYEVCDKKKHHGPTKEDDAVRPSDQAYSKRLQKADSYGHGKLEAEERLAAFREANKDDPQAWQYVFVRIPDVMGPKDTTYRWWLYQTLIKLQNEIGVPIPLVEEDDKGEGARKLSLVYVRDVAKAVVWLISGSNNNKVVDTAINIAGIEQMPFKTIIQDMAHELGVKTPIKYALNDTTDLPSVKRGPVDVTKARFLMGWTSTPWKEVVSEGVPWYEAAMTNEHYTKERDTMLTMAYQQVSRYGKQKALKEALHKVYGLTHTVIDRLLLLSQPEDAKGDHDKANISSSSTNNTAAKEEEEEEEVVVVVAVDEKGKGSGSSGDCSTSSSNTTATAEAADKEEEEEEGGKGEQQQQELDKEKRKRDDHNKKGQQHDKVKEEVKKEEVGGKKEEEEEPHKHHDKPGETEGGKKKDVDEEKQQQDSEKKQQNVTTAEAATNTTAAKEKEVRGGGIEKEDKGSAAGEGEGGEKKVVPLWTLQKDKEGDGRDDGGDGGGGGGEGGADAAGKPPPEQGGAGGAANSSTSNATTKATANTTLASLLLMGGGQEAHVEEL